MRSVIPEFLVIGCVFLGFLDNVYAGLTSSYIRSEFPAVDMPLDNEVFAIPSGYNAPQQVHITQGDYDGKSVIIMWVTPSEPGSNHVRYGTSKNNYDFTAQGSAIKNYTFYNYKSGFLHTCLVKDLEYDTKYFYEIGEGDSARSFWFQTPPKIDPNAYYKFGIIDETKDLSTSGISQGSGEYFYMVIDSGSHINWLQCQPCSDYYQQTDPTASWGACGLISFGSQNAVSIFSPQTAKILTTLPAHKASVNCTHWLPSSKFAFKSDLGQTFNSLSTLEHYMDSGASCVLFVGDLSYSDEHEYEEMGERWDSYGRFVERSTAYQPWLWIVGNHEVEYLPEINEVKPFRQYLYRYTTPYAASGSSSPLWYAVRRASAHIIFLSSYSPYVKYTPQYEWLLAELKKVDRKKTPWLFVLMHSPLYNSNSAHYMEAESMRVVFEKWFVEYKVDLVFAGHVHAYERSNRISNIRYNISNGLSYPIPDESAPIYVNIGDGGNLEGLASSYNDPQPDYSAFREASYGHSTLEIMNKTHAFYHWNRNDDGKKVKTDSVVLHNQYWKLMEKRSNL